MEQKMASRIAEFELVLPIRDLHSLDLAPPGGLTRYVTLQVKMALYPQTDVDETAAWLKTVPAERLAAEAAEAARVKARQEEAQLSPASTTIIDSILLQSNSIRGKLQQVRHRPRQWRQNTKT